jgi:phosphate transport system substrate-binding protein
MKKFVLAAAMTVAMGTANAEGRDTIEIVGSSTVYPFATVVAEKFGKGGEFKTPKIESTGSGGGMKLFCKGNDINTPDITNASRRIKKTEFEKCQANGVTDITEVLVGYDGIAVANAISSPKLDLTRADLYMALAAKVPGEDGKLIPNPYKTWKEVNAALPDAAIKVIGPPPSSGTRDAFAELALGGGAQSVEDIKTLKGLKADQADDIKAMLDKLGLPADTYDKMKEKKGKDPKGKDFFKKIAYTIREDGAYIEAGENDNLIVQKLEKDPAALGVFGYSFLMNNEDKLKGASIEGIELTPENIASKAYKVSRPLYFYIKKSHIGQVPGIQEFADSFVASKAIGEDGYLIDKGLIPLDDEKLEEIQADVKSMKNLTM